MKLSVSLPDDDVEFLDSYAASSGVANRSAALHRAVRLLRATSLGPAYEAAWLEWSSNDDGVIWDALVDDGLS
jgi:Arc/MetJ-type ribon-helix-helix transcriptional regulator